MWLYVTPFQDERKCRYKASCSAATDTGFVDIPHRDESALQTAVANIGPISVAIDASHSSFQVCLTILYGLTNACTNLYSSTTEVSMMKDAAVKQDWIMVYWLWAMVLRTVKITGLSRTGMDSWINTCINKLFLYLAGAQTGEWRDTS